MISYVVLSAAFIFFSPPQPLYAQSLKDVKALYRQGVFLYKCGQFDEAAQAFAHILEIDSHHKGAAVYLEEKIPNAIAKVENRKSHARDRELEQTSRQREKQVAAADSFLNRIELKQNKQVSIVETKLNDQLEKQIKLKIKQLYRQAIRAYRIKDYNNAAVLLEQVLLLDPKHKNAKAYLKKIQQQKQVLRKDVL